VSEARRGDWRRRAIASFRLPIQDGLPPHANPPELKWDLENRREQQAILEGIGIESIDFVAEDFEAGGAPCLEEHCEVPGPNRHTREVQQGVKVAYLQVTTPEAQAQDSGRLLMLDTQYVAIVWIEAGEILHRWGEA
jgi:hypothetical protein